MATPTRFAIVQTGVSNTGKTTTVRQVYDAMILAYPDHTTEQADLRAREVFAVVNVRGCRIGFQSMGDPGQGMMEAGLRRLVKAGCAAILCSCRTKGATLRAAASLVNDKYEIEWRRRRGFADRRGQSCRGQVRDGQAPGAARPGVVVH